MNNFIIIMILVSCILVFTLYVYIKKYIEMKNEVINLETELFSMEQLKKEIEKNGGSN